MAAIGDAAKAPTRLYFAGGATAVLFGWRLSTIDVDIKLEPDAGPPLQVISRLKEDLSINVELAAPIDFIPVPSGWQSRSPHIARVGRTDFFHFELVAQAMSKIERGHANDALDVDEMLARELVNVRELMSFLESIEPDLYRYPAIDPPTLRRQVSMVMEKWAD